MRGSTRENKDVRRYGVEYLIEYQGCNCLRYRTKEGGKEVRLTKTGKKDKREDKKKEKICCLIFSTAPHLFIVRFTIGIYTYFVIHKLIRHRKQSSFSLVRWDL